MAEGTTLDCGHKPNAPGCIARDISGKTLCYSCAEAQERRDFANPETVEFFAYLTERPKDAVVSEWPYRYRVSTWTGAKLGDVVYYRTARVGFGRTERWYITVKGPDGRVWKGQGPGPGMYVRLRLKSPKAKDVPAKRARLVP